MNKESVNITVKENQEWLKQGSLDLTRRNIDNLTYPGYPEKRLTIAKGAVINQEQIFLPEGSWHIPPTHPGISEEFSNEDEDNILGNNLRTDQFGRPVHPWIEELVGEDIGTYTGKGFYWKWGPNKTVDPIIFRHDLKTPHVLLIIREDTGDLAIPGGFHDSGETYAEGAAREAEEETLIAIGGLTARLVYSGPLADSRSTANSWPHTDAFRFDLTDEMAKKIPLEWEGGEETKGALFVPVYKVDELMFGSHSLLIKLAANLRR